MGPCRALFNKGPLKSAVQGPFLAPFVKGCCIVQKIIHLNFLFFYSFYFLTFTFFFFSFLLLGTSVRRSSVFPVFSPSRPFLIEGLLGSKNLVSVS